MKTFWRSFVTALKISLAIVLIVAIVGAAAFGWYYYKNNFAGDKVPDSDLQALASTSPSTVLVIPETEPPETEPETTEPPTTEPPQPEHVVATATIGATGDMLMHMQVINSGKQNDNSYNFDYIFQYLSEYTSSVDFAVANLETTLAGSGKPYSGYPQFNCPDAFVDGLKNAGFDMLLTANNHSYDTGEAGYFRTIEVIRGAGLETLGTMLNGEEPKYTIQDINGIKVGMLCYTYEGRPEGAMSSRVYLNGIAMHPGAEEVVNTFLPNNPTPFYNEVSMYLDEMKAAGAEATVIFMHWGVEYTTAPVDHQVKIAQGLCDLGFDVIVGGHPHVVEPVKLLTSSTDPNHKTVCLYSMGNAVSNQRAGNMKSAPSGHTEDGVWFTMTFSKYSDGKVYLENVDLVPTWVDVRAANINHYYIVPLDKARMDLWKDQLQLSDIGFNAACRSFDRTMKIVGDGLLEAQNYLAQQKLQREADYLAALAEQLYAA